MSDILKPPVCPTCGNTIPAGHAHGCTPWVEFPAQKDILKPFKELKDDLLALDAEWAEHTDEVGRAVRNAYFICRKALEQALEQARKLRDRENIPIAPVELKKGDSVQLKLPDGQGVNFSVNENCTVMSVGRTRKLREEG